MSLEFWITTAAILMGPIVAVMISQFLQNRKEKRDRKLHVFRVLMSSRRAVLSPERVHALNLVEVEFAKSSDVLREFEKLLLVYNDQARWKSDDQDVRDSVITDVRHKSTMLIKAIGKDLGFRFESLDLLQGGYYPEAFSELDNQQREIREFLTGLKKGTHVVPTGIVDWRTAEALLKKAEEEQLLIAKASDNEEKVS